ncbi:hypothetical protein MPSEU_000275900 [Mayamaea pseudoterrestris]|nr:hypothetical protein MPSEU_000275900 [Mayamaea pseudoterrestris]
MADLHHLLDEVLEPQQQDEQPDEQAEDWNEEDREQLTLPAALVEAERRKLNDTPDATDEERLDLGDVTGFTDLKGDTIYSKLQSLWTQELCSPEILPFDNDTVQALLEALETQEERMEELQTQGSSENVHLDALMTRILKIDAERAKFLLSGLLKQRLGKLEEYPLHMREHLDRLSDLEKAYLKEYGTMLERHLRKTVLDHFPQEVFKQLDEPEMIDEPDLETYIFVRCKEDVLVDNATDNTPPDWHVKGTVLIVRYSRIRDLYLENKVELLM